jgi:hypothetical protein
MTWDESSRSVGAPATSNGVVNYDVEEWCDPNGRRARIQGNRAAGPLPGYGVATSRKLDGVRSPRIGDRGEGLVCARGHEPQASVAKRKVAGNRFKGLSALPRVDVTMNRPTLFEDKQRRDDCHQEDGRNSGDPHEPFLRPNGSSYCEQLVEVLERVSLYSRVRRRN